MTPEDRAAEIVGRCREALGRGEALDLDGVLRAHEDLASLLRGPFAALERVRRAYAKESVHAAPSLAGRRLGPFRLDGALGSGGMGSVYLATVEAPAHGLAEGARVAVKVVHPHLVARHGYLHRFLREAEVGRRVRHENVVRTLAADAIEDGAARLHYLVTEYVEGRTLRALRDDLVRVPEELCRHIGREVAKALAAIHAAGAVHRDLKPDNVLITRDHVVKVMDLGVARIDDESMRLSQTGAFVGSVRYGAPEQFAGSGAEVDGRADLYALGLTLYELATGRHPFEGDDFRAVVRKQMTEMPRPAGEVNPQLSAFLEDVLRRLLEKDRGLRFASAEELLAALESGEDSDWWRSRERAIREETRRPLRRVRVPRETALYGRAAELAHLRALFDRATVGDGQVAVIEGEAGIGKSRLIDEFVGALAASGEDVNFLFGSYPPGGAATASGAFSVAFREHFGDAGSAPWLAQTPILVPAFDALLRGEPTPPGAEPLTRDSLQTVFVHATRALAAERPTIVFVDDLHFAPEEGRALFAALALAVPGHRVLLVGAARPTLDAAWLAQIERLGHATRLPLPRLGAEDLVLLLRDSLKSEHLAEELAARIAVKSDGNPFFVFEILRGLREGQFLTRRPDGTWATTKLIADIQVPSSVVELVQARVSDLGSDDRNVLEVASCVGFEFDPSLVGDVLRMERIPLLQRLGRIEKSHRLVRSAGRRFVFDHHQVMEVLYAGLSEPLREEYHAAIGTALEARSGAASKDPKDLEGALCVDLAEHLLKGAQSPRARRFLDPALTHLERSHLHEAAIRLADRALTAPGLVAGRERALLLIRASVRLELLGRRESERSSLESAIRLTDADGDRSLRCQGLISLGWHLVRYFELEAAERTLSEALAIARDADDRRSELRAEGILGVVCQLSSRFEEARRRHEAQLGLARRIDDRVNEVRALVNLANDFWYLGDFDEACVRNEAAVALAREAGDRLSEISAIGNLGSTLFTLGRMAEARAHHRRHLELARVTGNRRGEAMALFTSGAVSRILGRLEQATDEFTSCLALARDMAAPYEQGLAMLGLAMTFSERGEEESAERWFEVTLSVRRAVGDASGESEALCERGAHLALRGCVERARRDLEAACAIARRLPAPGEDLRPAVWLATLPGGEGQVADALASFAAHGARASVAHRLETRFLLWRCSQDRSHLAEATRLLGDLLGHAPPECRESMLANVRLHRDIASAAREHALPLAADRS